MDDDVAFDLIKKLIKEKTGFVCENYKDSFLKRRVLIRMRVYQFESFSDYLKVLRDDNNESEKLYVHLTVNVTNFFRNPEVFSELKNDVLPNIIEANKNIKKIKIWSACCSSGEEPYSLAMLFYDLLGLDLSGYDIKIVATDIDMNVIDKLHKGEYLTEAFREMDNSYIDKYFNIVEGSLGIYKIKDFVKNIVETKKLDLFTDKYINDCDLILCRNAIIYFDRESQVDIFNKFIDSLKKEKFLVLGMTESLIGNYAVSNLVQYNLRYRIYKKIN
jgi:chemotaxis protein methyltransferase CheR